MTSLLKKTVTSLSVAAVVLGSGVAVAADPVTIDTTGGEQLQQIIQEQQQTQSRTRSMLQDRSQDAGEGTREMAQQQDETQFRNRERLEDRINGSGGKAAQHQKRNEYRHMEQKSQGGASGGQHAYGQGGRGAEAGGSGRRMAGGAGAGGGGRR